MNGIHWIKATASGTDGNCVELGVSWTKATASGTNGDCVELGVNADIASIVFLRDSKNKSGNVILRTTPSSIANWLDGAKGGEFDHLSA